MQGPRFRARSVRASEPSEDDGPSSSGLTFGDILAEVVARQLSELSLDELIARDERVIDAMLQSAAAELDVEAATLNQELGAVSRNTTAALRSELSAAQARVLDRFDAEAVELGAASAPYREALRDEMQRTLEAILARRPLEPSEALSFYGRRGEVRDRAAAVRSPLYLACEGSAAVAGVLLLVAMLDIVSSTLGVGSRDELHELLVMAWRVAMAATAGVYAGTVATLLTTSEFNQFVRPSRNASNAIDGRI